MFENKQAVVRSAQVAEFMFDKSLWYGLLAENPKTRLPDYCRARALYYWEQYKKAAS